MASAGHALPLFSDLDHIDIDYLTKSSQLDLLAFAGGTLLQQCDMPMLLYTCRTCDVTRYFAKPGSSSCLHQSSELASRLLTSMPDRID